MRVKWNRHLDGGVGGNRRGPSESQDGQPHEHPNKSDVTSKTPAVPSPNFLRFFRIKKPPKRSNGGSVDDDVSTTNEISPTPRDAYDNEDCVSLSSVATTASQPGTSEDFFPKRDRSVTLFSSFRINFPGGSRKKKARRIVAESNFEHGGLEDRNGTKNFSSPDLRKSSVPKSLEEPSVPLSISSPSVRNEGHHAAAEVEESCQSLDELRTGTSDSNDKTQPKNPGIKLTKSVSFSDCKADENLQKDPISASRGKSLRSSLKEICKLPARLASNAQTEKESTKQDGEQLVRSAMPPRPPVKRKNSHSSVKGGESQSLSKLPGSRSAANDAVAGDYSSCIADDNRHAPSDSSTKSEIAGARANDPCQSPTENIDLRTINKNDHASGSEKFAARVRLGTFPKMHQIRVHSNDPKIQSASLSSSQFPCSSIGSDDVFLEGFVPDQHKNMSDVLMIERDDSGVTNFQTPDIFHNTEQFNNESHSTPLPQIPAVYFANNKIPTNSSFDALTQNESDIGRPTNHKFSCQIEKMHFKSNCSEVRETKFPHRPFDPSCLEDTHAALPMTPYIRDIESDVKMHIDVDDLYSQCHHIKNTLLSSDLDSSIAFHKCPSKESTGFSCYDEFVHVSDISNAPLRNDICDADSYLDTGTPYIVHSTPLQKSEVIINVPSMYPILQKSTFLQFIPSVPSTNGTIKNDSILPYPPSKSIRDDNITTENLSTDPDVKKMLDNCIEYATAALYNSNASKSFPVSEAPDIEYSVGNNTRVDLSPDIDSADLHTTGLGEREKTSQRHSDEKKSLQAFTQPVPYEKLVVTHGETTVTARQSPVTVESGVVLAGHQKGGRNGKGDVDCDQPPPLRPRSKLRVRSKIPVPQSVSPREAAKMPSKGFSIYGGKSHVDTETVKCRYSEKEEPLCLNEEIRYEPAVICEDSVYLDDTGDLVKKSVISPTSPYQDKANSFSGEREIQSQKPDLLCDVVSEAMLDNVSVSSEGVVDERVLVNGASTCASDLCATEHLSRDCLSEPFRNDISDDSPCLQKFANAENNIVTKMWDSDAPKGEPSCALSNIDAGTISLFDSTDVSVCNKSCNGALERDCFQNNEAVLNTSEIIEHEYENENCIMPSTTQIDSSVLKQTDLMNTTNFDSVTEPLTQSDLRMEFNNDNDDMDSETSKYTISNYFQNSTCKENGTLNSVDTLSKTLSESCLFSCELEKLNENEIFDKPRYRRNNETSQSNIISNSFAIKKAKKRINRCKSEEFLPSLECKSIKYSRLTDNGRSLQNFVNLTNVSINKQLHDPADDNSTSGKEILPYPTQDNLTNDSHGKTSKENTVCQPSKYRDLPQTTRKLTLDTCSSTAGKGPVDLQDQILDAQGQFDLDLRNKSVHFPDDLYSSQPSSPLDVGSSRLRCNASRQYANPAKSRIPKKHGTARGIHHPSPKPVRPPMWLSKAELTQEIQHLGNLCEARTKELNRLKMETKHITVGFDAFAALFKYMAEDLNAFSVPKLVEDLEKTLKQLELTKQDLAYYEKEVEELKVHHCQELTGLSDKLFATYQAQVAELNSKHQEELNHIKCDHQKQVENLSNNFNLSSEDVKLQHEKLISSLEQELIKQREELQMFQESEIKDLEEKHEEGIKALQSQIEQLQKKCSELKQHSTSMEDAMKNDTDTKLQWVTLRKIDLEKEVESLKTVLEMKNQELHTLRVQKLEMDKLLEELPLARERVKMLQARAEDLEALMDAKTKLERKLSTENMCIRETYERESKVNKRLSMENEELQWRLRQAEHSLITDSFTEEASDDLPVENEIPMTPPSHSVSRSVFFTFVDKDDMDRNTPQSPGSQYKKINRSFSASYKTSPARTFKSHSSTTSPKKSKSHSEPPQPIVADGVPKKVTKQPLVRSRLYQKRQRYESDNRVVQTNDVTDAICASVNESMASSASSESSVFEQKERLLEEHKDQIIVSLDILREQRSAEEAMDEAETPCDADKNWCSDNSVISHSEMAGMSQSGDFTDPKTYYHMTFPVLKGSGTDCDIDDDCKDTSSENSPDKETEHSILKNERLVHSDIGLLNEELNYKFIETCEIASINVNHAVNHNPIGVTDRLECEGGHVKAAASTEGVDSSCESQEMVQNRWHTM